ncbi:MAG: hypothetical protein IPL35_17305 [Sphingobacteriales bacterium]|nr:hypothetical protein [Sphingobacteriales bacterium]
MNRFYACLFICLFFCKIKIVAQNCAGTICTSCNTSAVITAATNANIIDNTATGSAPNLMVSAIGPGEVSIDLTFDFDWDQGTTVNWLHGVSFNAGPGWTATQASVPPGFMFMPNGVIGACSGVSYGAGYYYDTSGNDNSSVPGGCDDGDTYNEPNPQNSNPGNNWGYDCGYFVHPADEGFFPFCSSLNCNTDETYNSGNCTCVQDTPCDFTFSFHLEYCPTNPVQSNFMETISFTATADGNSGGWYQFDSNCDATTNFTVTILNAFSTSTCPCNQPQPDLVASPPAAICSGTSVNLANYITDANNTSGTYTYHTSNPPTAGNQIASSVVTPTVTTTYYVKKTASGCTDVVPITITVNPKPVATDPADVSACAGALVNMPVFSSAPAGATFTWINTNTATGIASSGSGNIADYTAPNVSTAQTSNIIITPTLNGCAGNSVAFTVTINPKPTVVDPADVTACAGTTVNMPVFSGTPANATFSWTNNNVNTGIGASGTGNIADYTGPNVATTQTSVITVTPNLPGGGCPGNPIGFLVTVNAKVTPTFSPIAAICSGGSFTLPSSSTNSPPIPGSWSPAVNTTATTTYTFTPAAGQCANTATLTVTVNAESNAYIQSDSGNLLRRLLHFAIKFNEQSTDTG